VTLTELAQELGVTQQATFVAAGRLAHRYGYESVIVDRLTGEITQQAEKAIRDLMAGSTNVLVMDT
jgi:hypothetical protein